MYLEVRIGTLLTRTVAPAPANYPELDQYTDLVIEVTRCERFEDFINIKVSALYTKKKGAWSVIDQIPKVYLTDDYFEKLACEALLVNGGSIIKRNARPCNEPLIDEIRGCQLEVLVCDNPISILAKVTLAVFGMAPRTDQFYIPRIHLTTEFFDLID